MSGKTRNLEQSRFELALYGGDSVQTTPLITAKPSLHQAAGNAVGSPLLGDEYDPVTTEPKGEALILSQTLAYSLVDRGNFMISAIRGLLVELHSRSEVFTSGPQIDL